MLMKREKKKKSNKLNNADFVNRDDAAAPAPKSENKKKETKQKK